MVGVGGLRTKLNILWQAGVRTMKFVAGAGALTTWSALKTVWLAGVRRVKFRGNASTGLFVVSAVLCMHFPGGKTPSDWFTLALGVFDTSIAFLVLGDLEKRLETPTLLRFLAANCFGAAVAAYVGQMSGFDWDDSDARVLGFGGAAVWMVGVHNLNLFLALSETVVNPFCRLGAAVVAAIATAITAAVFCCHHLLGEEGTESSRRGADLDLEALESGILLYASVSTWPLLLRFVKRDLARMMRRFNLSRFQSG